MGFVLKHFAIEIKYFPAVHDRIKENFIRNICECALVTTLHPRTAINIITQEMQDSGGVSRQIDSSTM